VYLILFSQVLNWANSLSNCFSGIQRGIASAERVFKLIDVKPQVLEPEHPVSVTSFKEEIRFENVRFSYDETRVLHDIDFSLAKGKVVALVGPSGGGKSSIADLIPRFYAPEGGRILLDGLDLKTYRVDDLRRLMGIVTQESILFNDTLFQNIAFGKPDARLEEVEQAARVANAHEFIEKMENGYQTLIGERGLKLSGGQRQRISIARAVLKNPPILILDEATSALDSQSEKLVQNAIFNLMKNRTTLVIAHRLSTVQHADEIIVIEKGRILERGDHEQLLQKGGIYKKLIEMQSMH
jgi:subfamily B ATP-binding cassette protein MsbA